MKLFLSLLLLLEVTTLSAGAIPHIYSSIFYQDSNSGGTGAVTLNAWSEMKRLILLALFAAGAAFAQCSSPCLFTDSGAGATTFSTSGVNSTGANFIAIALSYVTGNQPVVSDSEGNPAPTCLSAQSHPGGGSIRLCYLLNPIVGTNEVFTVTGTGIIYSSIEIEYFFLPGVAYGGITNGTNIPGPTTTFRPGSITPHAAGDIVIAVISPQYAGAGTLSIDNGFSLTNYREYFSGVWFGGGIAYLVSPAGAPVNPTWTDSNSEGAPLTIASFSQGGGGTVKGTTFAPFAPF